MKRPNKYDFDFSEDYESNLETYCDELEEIVSKGDCITHYEKEIQRLEKTQIEWVGRVLQVGWEFIL